MNQNNINKIPVKIARIIDSKGVEKITMGLNSRYYFKVKEDTHEKLSEFNKLYYQTINQINNIKTKNTPKGQQRLKIKPTTWWKIGRVLYIFNSKIENKFFVTNYSTALRKDTGISYLNEVMLFGKYLTESQVNDKVPFYYYARLLRKRTRLRRHGIFEQELEKLNTMGSGGNLPGYNNYSNLLEQTMKESRAKTKSRKNPPKIGKNSIQTKLF